MMQLAKMVGEIATGERDEETAALSDAAAVKRGKARADARTPKRREAIAKKAAEARWEGRSRDRVVAFRLPETH